MKFTYIEATGIVVGFNREAQEGELEGVCTPQHLTKGTDYNWYAVVSDSLVSKTQEEYDADKAKPDKDEAFLEALTNINIKCMEENAKNFQYNKGGVEDLTYDYIADMINIQAVAVETFSCPEDNPIPVPNGVWKTNDTEVDGVTPIYVAFKCSEFQLFKTAFYTRGSNNFGVKEVHKNAIKAIYLDPTKTAEDIKAYDYTQGWN